MDEMQPLTEECLYNSSLLKPILENLIPGESNQSILILLTDLLCVPILFRLSIPIPLNFDFLSSPSKDNVKKTSTLLSRANSIVQHTLSYLSVPEEKEKDEKRVKLFFEMMRYRGDSMGDALREFGPEGLEVLL